MSVVPAPELLMHFTAGEKAAPKEAVDYVKAKGVASLKNDKVVEFIISAIENVNTLAAREAGLAAVTALAKDIGSPAVPFMTPLLPVILTAYADKAPTVRTAAATAGKAFISVSCGSAQGLLLPPLFDAMEVKRNWQTKVGALQLLEGWSKSAPVEVALSLPEIIPVASGCLADAKPQVKNAAIKALTSASAAMGNKDIEKLVPVVISAMANPSQVPDTVHKLGATTFVAAVTASTLSLLVPLLVRGLRDRSTPIKRKACLVIDNMSKLVNNPADAAVFLPRLQPGLDAVRKEVANPECREVADRAHATLLRVGAKGKVSTPSEQDKAAEAKAVKQALVETVKAELGGKKLDEAVVDYVGDAALFQLHIKGTLMAIKVIDEPEQWNPRAREAVTPFLEAGLSAEEAKKVGEAFIRRIENEDDLKAANQEVDEEDGEPLTEKPLKFSLAYGAKILLNNAVLNLKRGKRYGLCGPNGCGKSTLMRSIANGQVKEFPPQDVLKTVYVEHDIDAEETQQSVINYVSSDSQLKDRDVKEIEETLESVGFTLEMRQKPIASLSGGWKMKLSLARAMLWNADILLLDEPTNHLDVTNVAWLENYLTHLPTVTSILVSHDSGFLDNVCTGIIHYEDLRLSQYRGNLSEFVKQKPEARSYYELSNLNLKFKFPEPGFLEGVKSKDRAILKMAKAGIRYPGMTKNVISNVTLQCSLNSRIAILGANGAGKSTMVKALIGELDVHEGTVWKHPNLRVAYVAQHAFHHIEKHLDKTPNQYIQWRYATGEDREGVDSVFRKATEEEEKKKAAAIKAPDGTKLIVGEILGRRKLKRGYEYEVNWKGQPMDKNEWLTRDQLEEMGWGKTLNDIDIKEAAKQGLVSRPLTEVNIAKHLADLGIEEEFGNHAHIRGLSGGQKVKCVLAACTWLSPHIIVLDEPTNYLDRDALGALAEAIKVYGGGVIMISHSSEFTSALCPEKWIVADGRLAIEGQTEAQKEQAKLEWKRQEEMTDAFGNTIKVKAPKKKLSNKEKLIGVAVTGSGKTAAFLLPLLVYISELPVLNELTKNDGPYAIILAPTRELAQQIEIEAKKFATPLGFTCVSIVGGHSLEEQAYNLRDGAEIIIATPGRLVDCIERRVLVLGQCCYVIMDEADRMIDLGFEEPVNKILDALPVANMKPDSEEAEDAVVMSQHLGGKDRYRQTMMYTATMPSAVERIARKYLRRPAIVTIGNVGEAVETVEQRVEFVAGEDKRKKRLLEVLSSREFQPPIIVFVNIKRNCDAVARDIKHMGFSSVTLHGSKTQEQREAALASVRSGSTDVLVATDLAGRGIDVPDVSLVVNFNMATNIESYTHRIGRTGRAGKSGIALTFLGNEDADVMYDLKQMLMKSSISRVPEELRKHEAAQQKSQKGGGQKKIEDSSGFAGKGGWQ